MSRRAEAAEVRRHATAIKWYAEVLIEEDPSLSVEVAMRMATASYSFIGVQRHLVEPIKDCVAGLGYADLSFKTKLIMSRQLRPYARSWIERCALSLRPYL